MANVASIIRSSNNRKHQSNHVMTPCNCRQHSSCPLEGNCQAESIVYKATVTNNATGSEMDYFGVTDPPFKQRYANHLTSFGHEKYASQTVLSKR